MRTAIADAVCEAVLGVSGEVFPVPIMNIFSIARFELTRVFATLRGGLFVLAFLLLWALILRYAIFTTAGYLASVEGRGVLGGILGGLAIPATAVWTVPELWVFWLVGLYLFPLFALLIAADQTASDRARGTLRLLCLRATRDSVFFGRFLGQLLVQGILFGIALASTIVVVSIRDVSVVEEALQICVYIVPVMLIVLLPLNALMALVSVLARSARQATLYAVLLWLACSVLVAWLKGYWPVTSVLDWLVPGAHIPALMLLHAREALSHSMMPLLQAVVLLAAGRVLMQRAAL